MSEDGEVRVGTSGWVYKHWMGIFYPRGMSGPDLLRFYAEHFDTVEINFSFYRLPERSVFEEWKRQTPEGFLFAVKGSRYLTHMKKLKVPEEPLHRLLDRASGLQEKLGPILFQFPAKWGPNLQRLSDFLALLRLHQGYRFAFEFRHPGWLVPEVYALLEEAGCALCLPVHPALPLDVRLTSTWTYIRFHAGRHGIGFTDEELSVWSDCIAQFVEDGMVVHTYFNNDPGGHALHDAKRLKAMLGMAATTWRKRTD